MDESVVVTRLTSLAGGHHRFGVHYSSKCPEGRFSELPLNGVLGSSAIFDAWRAVRWHYLLVGEAEKSKEASG